MSHSIPTCNFSMMQRYETGRQRPPFQNYYLRSVTVGDTSLSLLAQGVTMDVIGASLIVEAVLFKVAVIVV